MESTNFQESLRQVYDYIVVGAGSSGCVIASRLSEIPNCTVLVLEAGGDDREYPDIPVPRKCGGLASTDCDWGLQMVRQNNVFKGYKNQIYNTVCGKVLGGSGSINYMVYMRGTPHDYDLWKSMGCDGWGYNDVLPYFIKSENCRIDRLLGSGYRGTSGAMMVSEAEYSPLAGLFLKGAEELGYPETDCNSDNPIGFMVTQSNTGNGVRQSTMECFLRPASVRPNLHIATRCHVTKIIINKHTAEGVQFHHRDNLYNIKCSREVIVSAGAYNTPKILMLSGIGPEDHLKTLGVDRKPYFHATSVWYRSLWYNIYPWVTIFRSTLHAVIGIEFEIEKPLSHTPLYKSPQSAGRKDPDRTKDSAASVTGLIRTKCQVPGNPNPDVQLFMEGGLTASGKHDRPKFMAGIKDDVYDAMFGGNDGKDGFGIAVLNPKTKSRGTVRLGDADPFTNPVIDHQTLDHPGDVEVLLEGIKFVMSLEQTTAFRSVGARFAERVLPDYEGTPFTEEYWEEYVRTLTNTFHPAGSCRMGRVQDDTTVVDPQLRVKGVQGLRVADASDMPEITSANLFAVCVMIGEKAADLIKCSLM